MTSSGGDTCRLRPDFAFSGVCGNFAVDSYLPRNSLGSSVNFRRCPAEWVLLGGDLDPDDDLDRDLGTAPDDLEMSGWSAAGCLVFFLGGTSSN